MTASATLSTGLLASLNAMLAAGVRVPDCGETEIIHKETINFGEGLEADIKLVNSDGGPYVDPVLFADGHECGLLEPRFMRFEGTYAFDLDGRTYTAVVQ